MTCGRIAEQAHFRNMNILSVLLTKIRNRLLHYGKITKECTLLFLLYPVAVLKLGRHNRIHIFSERGTDARDNGFALFKYYRTVHPEIKSYYIIDRKSADYSKVAALGPTIQYKSLKHYLYFIGAKYKISSHIMGFSPDPMIYIIINKSIRVPGRQISIRHGVTVNNTPGVYKENTQLDLICCGAKPEYEFVKEYFHYKDNEIKYTGLARYDNLQSFQTKQFILVMPTWRVYFNRLSEEEFRECDYYKQWSAVLRNEKLHQVLKQFKLKLIFYPHYEMQKYVKLFQMDCDEVVIADFNHYDVQQLLKEANLLVTDFSSVFFDFAYMMKPAVYFQFDAERFHSQHYQEGYFSFREMGFGEVFDNPEDVCEDIAQYCRSGFRMNEQYIERAKRFFVLHDNKNSERIFEEIEKLS